MALKSKKDEIEVRAEPNVVPLCDVLLVLLIIFMVATPLIHKGINVTLPTALNTINMPENPEVLLTMRRDGSMYLNEDKVEMDTLQTMIEEAFITATDKKLYLKADGELKYGNIVDIVDILKVAGVEIIGIITEIKTG